MEANIPFDTLSDLNTKLSEAKGNSKPTLNFNEQKKENFLDFKPNVECDFELELQRRNTEPMNRSGLHNTSTSTDEAEFCDFFNLSDKSTGLNEICSVLRKTIKSAGKHSYASRKAINMKGRVLVSSSGNSTSSNSSNGVNVHIIDNNIRPFSQVTSQFNSNNNCRIERCNQYKYKK